MRTLLAMPIAAMALSLPLTTAAYAVGSPLISPTAPECGEGKIFDDEAGSCVPIKTG